MMGKQLSWSVFRYETFAFCKRAYFYRYHLSFGGWDKYSAGETKKIYLLKNVLNANQWIFKIFRGSVRKYLELSKTVNKESPALLVSNGIFEFNKSWDEAMSAIRDKNTDGKIVSISEIFHGNIASDSLPGFRKKLMDKLLRLFSSFLDGALWREFENLSYLSFRNLSHPESFVVKGMQIFLEPDFLVARGKDIEIISLFVGAPAENINWDLRTAVSAIFAKTKCNGEILPRAVFFRPEELSVYASRNLFETSQLISSSFSEMLEFEKETSNISNIYDIPSSRCENCEFRSICVNIQ
jgi:hypothetical protein